MYWERTYIIKDSAFVNSFIVGIVFLTGFDGAAFLRCTMQSASVTDGNVCVSWVFLWVEHAQREELIGSFMAKPWLSILQMLPLASWFIIVTYFIGVLLHHMLDCHMHLSSNGAIFTKYLKLSFRNVCSSTGMITVWWYWCVGVELIFGVTCYNSTKQICFIYHIPRRANEINDAAWHMQCLMSLICDKMNIKGHNMEMDMYIVSAM